jgi:hypothetical protein
LAGIVQSVCKTITVVIDVVCTIFSSTGMNDEPATGCIVAIAPIGNVTGHHGTGRYLAVCRTVVVTVDIAIKSTENGIFVAGSIAIVVLVVTDVAGVRIDGGVRIITIDRSANTTFCRITVTIVIAAIPDTPN